MKTLENTLNKLESPGLTSNLQSTGDNYEERELLLVKVRRQRKGPAVCMTFSQQLLFAVNHLFKREKNIPDVMVKIQDGL